VRFADRLQLSVDVPRELFAAQVPSLILQPLVENAIKHGIGQRVAGGTVRVSAARQDGCLCLTVYNEGPSLPVDWESTTSGVGLTNLRTRLKILYGSAAGLLLRPVDPTGVEVVVTLPVHAT